MMDLSDNSIFSFPKPDKAKYLSAEPFAHGTFTDIFNREFLIQVAAEFPDLAINADRIFNNHHEKKHVTFGESKLSDSAKTLVRFCNSEPFLLWLTELTGNENLMPDPYLIGGGYHEIKTGGKLGIHVDFDKHGTWGANRRINVLIYLNENWQPEWGGGIKLYDTNLDEKVCVNPELGNVVIFSTTDKSWHGHPEPLTCPKDKSRKSIALYYYTAPEMDWKGNDTIFRG
jgi:Rps23 Pro-64 3,4-dihydroxylase Tpa1-like proline 4-hydroxylase